MIEYTGGKVSFDASKFRRRLLTKKKVYKIIRWASKLLGRQPRGCSNATFAWSLTLCCCRPITIKRLRTLIHTSHSHAWLMFLVNQVSIKDKRGISQLHQSTRSSINTRNLLSRLPFRRCCRLGFVFASLSCSKSPSCLAEALEVQRTSPIPLSFHDFFPRFD